jgi:hypothetical protein
MKNNRLCVVLVLTDWTLQILMPFRLVSDVFIKGHNAHLLYQIAVNQARIFCHVVTSNFPEIFTLIKSV